VRGCGNGGGGARARLGSRDGDPEVADKADRRQRRSFEDRISAFRDDPPSPASAVRGRAAERAAAAAATAPLSAAAETPGLVVSSTIGADSKINRRQVLAKLSDFGLDDSSDDDRASPKTTSVSASPLEDRLRAEHAAAMGGGGARVRLGSSDSEATVEPEPEPTRVDPSGAAARDRSRRATRGGSSALAAAARRRA
jgi:hypothetical protein